MINPDLGEKVSSDPFSPWLYDMDYLFASVMLSNPLFWFELQHLPENRRAELKPLLEIWKEHRLALSSSDVVPIGERPSGRSFTGFFASNEDGDKYLLLFREVTNESTGVFRFPVEKSECQILASNGDVDIKVDNGAVTATFSKQRCYAFVKLK